MFDCYTYTHEIFLLNFLPHISSVKMSLELKLWEGEQLVFSHILSTKSQSGRYFICIVK